VNRTTCVWLLALLTILTTSVARSAAVPQSEAADTQVSSVPPAPTGLTATAGEARITLSWSAATDAASYNVYRRMESSNDAVQVAAGIAVSTFVDRDVTNGTTYYYWVQASSDGATSTLSNRASASLQLPQLPQPSASAAPQNLTRSAGDAVAAQPQPPRPQAPVHATPATVAAVSPQLQMSAPVSPVPTIDAPPPVVVNAPAVTLMAPPAAPVVVTEPVPSTLAARA